MSEKKKVQHQRGCGLTGFLIIVIVLGVGRSLLYFYMLKQDYERISCGCSPSSSYWPWQP